MNYNLNKSKDESEINKSVFGTAVKRLFPLLKEEKGKLIYSIIAILISSIAFLLAPMVIAHVVDTYIRLKDFSGVLSWSIILVCIYLVAVLAQYFQIRTMGAIGRRILFNLRNQIFNKLQELPIAFFNQNKAGDLISRINNDTEKLNQFFAQALMRFIGNVALIVGTGVFILVLNFKLGLAAMLPAFVAIILTQLLSPWVKKTNLSSLRSMGSLSAEIQESLNNFKVIVAFNRLDYFNEKFRLVNEQNYKSAISAGISSNVFNPIYTLASVFGQIVVLAYGIYLILSGSFTVGLLIGFLLYLNNFYSPLRELATVWSSLQQALAGLDRISEILSLETNMSVIEKYSIKRTEHLIEFDDVSFHYSEGTDVLRNINMSLTRGKTYALVGPTGGGKTTTASLMARLYDPTKGVIYLHGKDIRAYSEKERSEKIGFILQEPFIFAGTLADNILYGNEMYQGYFEEEIAELLKAKGLDNLISRFPNGLKSELKSTGDVVSLGQKQIVAFMRAVLREPEILILDEATANIDTVTEQLLEEILEKLPKSTTKIIIAHRLNTIENADEIFFVNGGEIKSAGNIEHAVEMLLHNKRQS